MEKIMKSCGVTGEHQGHCSGYASKREMKSHLSESIRKQLKDYKNRGKGLKYLINYMIDLVDQDDLEQIIISEMKELAFNEDEIVEILEYDFGFDMSWHPQSVNYKK